jgi:hypothetical protein
MEDYMEAYISAEIPELPTEGATEQQKRLYRLITMKNVHMCKEGRCLIDGKCYRRFPVNTFIK